MALVHNTWFYNYLCFMALWFMIWLSYYIFYIVRECSRARVDVYMHAYITLNVRIYVCVSVSIYTHPRLSTCVLKHTWGWEIAWHALYLGHADRPWRLQGHGAFKGGGEECDDEKKTVLLGSRSCVTNPGNFFFFPLFLRLLFCASLSDGGREKGKRGSKKGDR